MNRSVGKCREHERHLMFWVFACGCGGFLVPAVAAQSESSPRLLLETQLAGSPDEARRRRPVPLRAERSAEGVSLRLGRNQPVLLPLMRTARATVRYAPDHNLALVEVWNSGDVRQGFFLISSRPRARVIHSAESQWHGIASERRRGVIAWPESERGSPVVVATQTNLSLCGRDPAWLGAARVDPNGRLQQIPTPHGLQGETRTVGRVSQNPATPFARVHNARASSAAGLGRSASVPALHDRDVHTKWIPDSETGPAGEFVTASVDSGGVPLQGLRIAWDVPDDPRRLASEASLWIVGSTGPPLRITTSNEEPGATTVFVPLDPPATWDCVSLVLENTPREITELEAVSVLSGARGTAKLIDTLTQDDNDAASAERVLEGWSTTALAPLVAALPELPAAGQARAVRILARRLPEPQIESALIAFGTSQAATAPQALTLWAERASRASLEAFFDRESHDVGAPVLRAVLPRFPDLAARILLRNASNNGLLNTDFIRFFRLAFRDSPTRATTQLRTWLNTMPGLAAVARVADALRTTPRSGTALLALISYGLHSEAYSSAEFGIRFRLLRAAAHAPPHRAFQQPLERLTRADEWMLRAAAVRALDRHGADPDKLGRFLQDPYPRVRCAALESLAGSELAEPLLQKVQASLSDRWPMVRIASLQILAEHSTTRDALVPAVVDRTPAVRRAAIELLTTHSIPRAFKSIQARIVDTEEHISVLRAALLFAKQHGTSSWAPILLRMRDQQASSHLHERRALSREVEAVLQHLRRTRVGEDDSPTEEPVRQPESGQAPPPEP